MTKGVDFPVNIGRWRYTIEAKCSINYIYIVFVSVSHFLV